MISYRALAIALHDAGHMERKPAKNPTWAGLEPYYHKALEAGGGLGTHSHAEPVYAGDLLPSLQDSYFKHLAELGPEEETEEENTVTEDPDHTKGPSSVGEPNTAREPAKAPVEPMPTGDDKKDDEKEHVEVQSPGIAIAKELVPDTGKKGPDSAGEPVTARAAAEGTVSAKVVKGGDKK